jgi:NADPH:quinone reductase-like Zn-dependent oxidoreductase
MHAITFAQYGDPEVLTPTDLPEVDADAGYVRVAVRAAAVNPIDWKIRSGMLSSFLQLELPAIPGAEFAGIVDEVGEGVTRLAAGDEVLGRGSGCYAEQVVVHPAMLSRKPAGLSWEQAAALPIAADTSFRVLAPLDLHSGQTLLVDGAAGGVGGILVQIARSRGLHVIGTASPENHERLRALGAIPVNYGDGLAERVAAVASHGVDAAADLAGKGSLATLVQIVGNPDKVITIVDSAGAQELGVRFSGGGSGDAVDGALDETLRLYDDGELSVPVGNVYPLDEAAAAHRESEGGRSDGRIVLRVA